MAKIIISSKYLQSLLSHIDFKDDGVEFIKFNGQTMNICADKIMLEADISDTPIKEHILNQSTNRWEWVYKLVCEIEEQPIVMDITEERVNITVSY